MYISGIDIRTTNHKLEQFIVKERGCLGFKSLDVFRRKGKQFAIAEFDSFENMEDALQKCRNCWSGKSFLNCKRYYPKEKNQFGSSTLFIASCCEFCFKGTSKNHLCILDKREDSNIYVKVLNNNRKIEIELGTEYILEFYFSSIDKIYLLDAKLHIEVLYPPKILEKIYLENVHANGEKIITYNQGYCEKGLLGATKVYVLALEENSELNKLEVLPFFEKDPGNVIYEQYGTPYKLSDFEKLDQTIYFKLAALVSQKILYEFNFNDAFKQLIEREHHHRKDILLEALNSMLQKQKRIFNPYAELSKEIQEYEDGKPKAKHPKNFIQTARATVTPTSIILSGPEYDTSCRIFRQYSAYLDRFIRVSFKNDSGDKIAQIYYSIEKLSTYILKVLENGFKIGKRHYDFLCITSSQLNDHSCVFFSSPGPHLTCNHIRRWMGNLDSIKVVGKYIARMGLCFSDTKETVEVSRDEWQVIDDIEANGYSFTDGIGQISKELAEDINKKLEVDGNEVSCYQIRFSGAKGVVSINPQLHSRRLLIRKSMLKISSDHYMLEVILVGRELPCFLNRQIIAILSTLNIEDGIFEQMQDEMIKELQDISKNRELATAVLQRNKSRTGIIFEPLWNMIKARLPLMDPFIRRLLNAIRIKVLTYLRIKTRIFIEKGACLMGAVDEYQVLRSGQVYVHTSSQGVICGKVGVTKNPCLHPGDYRVFEAVNEPVLSHMKNCIVFPSVGDRPHPNEICGSDLDGDTYFTTWDQRLIPAEVQYAMDYTPAKPCEVSLIQLSDIYQFFIDYIKNDNLGFIALSHLAISDESKQGLLDERCIKLAKLHSIAVDYCKTGVKATVSKDYKAYRYPDFMEKEPNLSYESKKIIGKLYRKIKGYSNGKTYDKVNESDKDPDLFIEKYERFMEEGRRICSLYYSDLRGIMNKYKVFDEAELLVCFTKSKEKDIGSRLQKDVEALQRTYRRKFKETVEENDRLCKAYAWYVVAFESALEKQSKSAKSPKKKKKSAFISFGYIAYDYLIKLKCRSA